MDETRRSILKVAGLVPALLLAGPVLAAKAKPAGKPCPDAASLPAGAIAQRKSLNYLEPATDPNKRCGKCFWFAAAKDGGCGACRLMGGNPVSPNGVCVSFAPAKKK